MKTLMMLDALTVSKQRRQLRSTLAAAALLLTLGALATPARACASISIEGPTYTEAERAVIFWDGPHRVEHFIRQASVFAGGGEMAFLVPTPETPQISDVDPALFALAGDVARPARVAPVKYETPWDIFAPYRTIFRAEMPTFEIAPSPSSPTKPAAAHRGSGLAILEQDVAGYHVTVLATDDYPAIVAWLAKNGYPTTPHIEAWVKTYAVRHWKINAFRLIKAQQNGDGTLTTPPLRLTFHTDAPYYPYSEPADRQLPAAASPGGRILTVAIVSTARMTGQLADGYAWPGQLQYAGPSAPGDMGATLPARWLAYAGLADGSNVMKLPAWLTTFVDTANPRHGTADLYFSPSADPSAYRGTESDYSLPVERRLDWSRPVSLLTGFAAMLLVPGAPLYCGARALWVARRRRDGQLPLVEALGWRVGDQLLGLIAFFLGLIGSIPSGMAATAGIAGLVMGEPEAFPTLLLGLPALLACIATVSCGRTAMYHWTEPRRIRRTLSPARRRVGPIRPAAEKSVPAAPVPVEKRPLEVPVPRIRYDVETGIVTELEKANAPFKRYDRVMALGSVTCGTVVLIAVAAIFFGSATI